ncbi:hypothetical protein IK1_06009 [Bacillus cereus VD146]|uniref:Uncharacterized protein n=1 Tax=Bacillus cereus (strain VD146) TaxID=1053236 RepID=R8MFD9_BACCX|nr:hypothetical protein IK1_06009 [Bacillus cereus VD146]
MKRFLLFLHCCFWLNICLLPISFFIGGMATDAPWSGWREFFCGFLYIQGIPLIVFITGFFILVVINNSSKKK